ncbi:MAG: pseudouridine synthase, partial [Bacteroidales bacterium]|nr:pseudouridine synthase [Bacteroidales bacterium]
VHRIDRDTTGLLLVAKTGKARRALGKQFEDKTIVKKYVAIVIGKPKKHGIISEPIDNKDTMTNYSLLSSNDNIGLVELEPVTGRTHQLRIHMQFIGTPILGDPLYGGNSVDIPYKGLYLCAYKIKFHHPIKDEIMEFQINFPKKFKGFQL